MLYLFAGKPREGNIKYHLTHLQSQLGFTLKIDEVDWERDPPHDLSKTALWEEILDKVKSGYYDLIEPVPWNFLKSKTQ